MKHLPSPSPSGALHLRQDNATGAGSDGTSGAGENPGGGSVISSLSFSCWEAKYFGFLVVAWLWSTLQSTHSDRLGVDSVRDSGHGGCLDKQ